jgi:hypothetical protein
VFGQNAGHRILRADRTEMPGVLGLDDETRRVRRTPPDQSMALFRYLNSGLV